MSNASLWCIPAGTAEHYRSSKDMMAVAVSQRIAAHPRLSEFLGGNPLRLLDTNHRNHAAFMVEVFIANDPCLLEEALPWVYSAYHNQGIAFDYFAAELEAWIAVIGQMLPPEDAAAILPVYRWMLDAHPRSIERARQYQARRLPVSEVWRHDYDFILEHLFQGDYPVVIRHCRGLMQCGMSYAQVLRELFYPAMVEVGARWESGEFSVEMEHQTTAMVYCILSALYYDQPFPSMSRGRALIAPVANEFHELGAWMLTTTLELDGWEVTLMGCDTTPELLAARALAERPRFIALSVTLVSNVQEARHAVSALRAALGAETPPILVGGQAFLLAPALAETVGADLFLESVEALVDWARTLETAE
ncbi:cobalamin B12-binding domain-containing protein [Allochromatium vinosum]|uniref:Cobalamin B12-binding domain protein n=1 Tax=Allochromatium vinosum (strain ATCC 17899 / DSM 180 / NBRC 103801 / NCIMB 10441 / D) TaxID=572477 RepID=D3RMR6_ALLVD|nr:cobalamin-dependent protein [Allochromatium vinosum]ADC63204.1 cobalamin B12-binding domain protein [Allochromatium vinosum DSM 180]